MSGEVCWPTADGEVVCVGAERGVSPDSVLDSWCRGGAGGFGGAVAEGLPVRVAQSHGAGRERESIDQKVANKVAA